MNEAEHFQRVDELFREALRLPQEQRARLLDERCESEAPLRAEVEALLREDAATRGALDAPAINEPIRLSRFEDLAKARAEPIPDRLGHYRVISRLGVGGMGTVYEAEQESPRRRVAVKVINAGLVSTAALRRFEQEARVLARLEHPAIARIFEAGVHEFPGGPRPFFAMELVKGQPLIEYANAHSTRERLQLFSQICDGVHHAHQRGVIHRDLKPANILVDQQGRPRILDFGVARAVDDEAQTLLTNAGQIIGTVAYMSPEQASGDASAIDTRADVYALGVIGYEMIAGKLPYDIKGKSLPDALRAVEETGPVPIGTVDRSLRGDVETILGKALEKDKTRRYDSCAALADDVRRFLSNEAILARPPSRVYQLRKFAARNQALVGSVALAIVALGVGLGVALVALGRTRDALADSQHQTQIANDALEDAKSQRQVAEAAQTFMSEDLLGAVSPDRLGKDATVHDALDQAAEKIDVNFKDSPAVMGTVHLSVANLYKVIGDWGKAQTHYLRAKEILDTAVPRENQHRLMLLNDLAWFYLDGQNPKPAIALLEESIPLCRKTFGENAPETIRAESDLGSALVADGEYDKAMTHLKALAARFAASHEFDEILAKPAADQALPMTRQQRSQLWARSRVYHALGILGFERHAPEEALDSFRHVLEIESRVDGLAGTLAIGTRGNIAACYEQMGKLDEAEKELREVIARETEIYGRHHPETLPALHNLASVFEKQGRLVEAETLLVEVLAACREDFGDQHIGTIRSMGKLGDVLVKEGKLEQAEPLLKEALAICQKMYDSGHPEIQDAIEGLERLQQARAKITPNQDSTK